MVVVEWLFLSFLPDLFLLLGLFLGCLLSVIVSFCLFLIGFVTKKRLDRVSIVVFESKVLLLRLLLEEVFLQIGHRQSSRALQLAPIVSVPLRRLLAVSKHIQVLAVGVELSVECVSPNMSVLINPHQILVEHLDAFVGPALALTRARRLTIDASVFNETTL